MTYIINGYNENERNEKWIETVTKRILIVLFLKKIYTLSDERINIYFELTNDLRISLKITSYDFVLNIKFTRRFKR